MVASEQPRARVVEPAVQEARSARRQAGRVDTTVTLRPASLGEEKALTELAIRSKAHWGYDDAFLTSCLPELTVTPQNIAAGALFVAQREGTIVGMASLDLTLEPPELGALFVDPPAIGTGVGRSLLAEALSRARAAGVRTLQIESDPNAEPFYLSQGARRVGEKRSAATGRLLPLLAIATARRRRSA